MDTQLALQDVHISHDQNLLQALPLVTNSPHLAPSARDEYRLCSALHKPCHITADDMEYSACVSHTPGRPLHPEPSRGTVLAGDHQSPDWRRFSCDTVATTNERRKGGRFRPGPSVRTRAGGEGKSHAGTGESSTATSQKTSKSVALRISHTE